MPEDRQFVGFDAYKKAMDCLKPGDVAIFATPPAFRWVHFRYAIEKGVNVFMEKPITVDGPTTRRMLALGEEAAQEEPEGGRGPDGPPLQGPAGTATSRIRDGEIGDLITLRAYRMHGPIVGYYRPKHRRHQRTALPDPDGSTASCGPAAAPSATSTSTRSTSAAG